MDQERFSFIAHSNLEFCNPFSKADLKHMIEQLPDSGTTVDIGCGKGSVTQIVADGSDRKILAIDRAKMFLDQAKKDHDHPNISWKEGDANDSLKPVKDVKIWICLGSTHALSGYEQTLRFAHERSTSGGVLLVGEGFWEKSPDPDYLKFLGCVESDLNTSSGNIELAKELGWTCVESLEASQKDWDHYEDSYFNAMKKHLHDYPDDPDHKAFDAKINAWRDAYLKWGRGTLGFGLYLFRKD